MAENIRVPLPPALEEEDEQRRGGGIIFWLSSMPVRVAFITAVTVLAFLVARDFIFKSRLGNPRLDATRAEMAPTDALSKTGNLSRESENADDPFGLRDRPPPSLPRESSGLVGSVSTSDLEKGRHAWGGLRPAKGSERSSARADGKARYDKNGDPIVTSIAGREISDGSIGGGAASGRGGDGEGGGIGRMDNKERNTKSIMRGWGWKAGNGGSKREIGKSGALDTLKGMEASMKAYGGRNATSAGSAHKKMWDAASYTDWKLETQASKGKSSVKDYKIGGKTVKRSVIVDAGEGGPLAASAAAADSGPKRNTGSSGNTFTADETPQEEFHPATGFADGGDLLPMALLQATGVNAAALPGDIGAAQALGAEAAGLLGLSGVGMMATGQTVQGASLAGLGALIAAQSRGN
ncbi:MAG: hypothetical protein COB53_11795 [Elusimicrobia bacterium]|nr:MAG: hypothetical protein COB53_11795 [Elusimicrobiota bacterium]